MDSLRFTVPEVLSLIGVFQCVYLLVHIAFKVRKGSVVRLILPLMYFFTLGCAFFIDLARRSLLDISVYYDVFSWGAWTLIAPLGVLLIIQISQIHTLPSLRSWLILLVMPLALGAAFFASHYTQGVSQESAATCSELYEWLNVTGVIAGATSLLMIWTRRNIFADILEQKAGKERYWLILTLIIVNVAFLGLMALRSGSNVNFSVDISLVRTVLGLSFVYLVSTSLLRIYPVALFLPYQGRREFGLNQEDQALAKRIEDLFAVDKIYHEPTYSRSDLARELGISEGSASRIINTHFSKSFPQLLNEHRIDDSKRLLIETKASIRVVSEEVGFNSVPSFNRVFKDMVGQSPSGYRKNMIK